MEWWASTCSLAFKLVASDWIPWTVNSRVKTRKAPGLVLAVCDEVLTGEWPWVVCRLDLVQVVGTMSSSRQMKSSHRLRQVYAVQSQNPNHDCDKLFLSISLLPT